MIQITGKNGNFQSATDVNQNYLFFPLLMYFAAEKMEEKEANDIMTLLDIKEDDDGLIMYMGKSFHFTDKKKYILVRKKVLRFT